jgi:hypothetical protein
MRDYGGDYPEREDGHEGDEIDLGRARVWLGFPTLRIGGPKGFVICHASTLRDASVCCPIRLSRKAVFSISRNYNDVYRSHQRY